MKLRISSVLLALALVFSMLAGCQPSVPVIDPTDVPARESTSETDSSEPSSDPTSDTEPVTVPETTEPDTPIVAPADFFTENGQPELPASAEIPAYCIETQTPHLYTCPLELPQTYGYQTILPNDGMLYVFYWLDEDDMLEGTGCSVYSLETGELVREMQLPDWSVWGPLDGGGLWVVEFPMLQMTFYDSTGDARIVCEAAAPSEDERTAQSVTVSADGRYMLALYGEGDPLTVHNLETGEQTVPVFSENAQFWTMQETENGFLLEDTYGGLTFLDPASGNAEAVYTDRKTGTFYGGINACSDADTLCLSSITADTECFYMKLDSYEWLADIACGCAVTHLYYPESILRFYDLRNSMFISEISFPPDTYDLSVDLLEDGTALIWAYKYGGADVYLYDLPAAAVESETPVETLLCTDEELQAETARIAAEIEAETGVDLLYASEGNDFLLSGYVGVAELDPYIVYASVSTVAEILSRYPEGMLREAYEGTHNGLRIYLCGTLYGVGGGSLDTAGGCTASVDGYIVVAVDVHNNLEYDIPHELSHAFDNRISQIFWEGGTDWMAVWDSVNPFADAYTNTYDDYYSNMDYTAGMEEDPDWVWFVDTYARTFPTEDRARIMEHLFNGSEDGLADVLQYENLQMKARLYCYILRQCFPSCDTEETLYWEQHLGTIDASVLPE